MSIGIPHHLNLWHHNGTVFRLLNIVKGEDLMKSAFGIMFHHFHGKNHPVGQGSISDNDLDQMIAWLKVGSQMKSEFKPDTNLTMTFLFILWSPTSSQRHMTFKQIAFDTYTAKIVCQCNGSEINSC